MLHGLRTYGVSAAARKPLTDFMVSALESAGCRIIHRSEDGKAPFIITFETATGERIGIVAYAFLATRTLTRNRPLDERSFQIKYGSKKDSSFHRLWMDPLGLYTTLFLGIDPKEGFFIAADPAVHNPTRLFIRLEFKDEHADNIRSKGWYAWERSKRAINGFEEPIEVLVGGTKNHFLDLVRFERAAADLSPGDRQLLAEKPELFVASTNLPGVIALPDNPVLHPLLKEFDLDTPQLLELIANARRIKMAVRGGVAEKHLHDFLCKVPDVTRCERLDTEGSPDIRLSYREQRLLTIECKNVLRVTDRENRPRIDFQRTRTSKSNPCSRYYAPSDFEIVAGCLHAVTENWEFKFSLTSELPPHNKCGGKITNNIKIDTAWAEEPQVIFERAYSVLGR